MTISDKRLEGMVDFYHPSNETVGRCAGTDDEMRSILTELQFLRSQAGVSEAVEPDAYVDWKAQCVWMAESIKDASGLQPVWFARPAPIEITEEMIEKAAEAAITARIIPDSCQLMDYIDDLSAQDAIDLGVTLTEKTEEGKPRFHPLSYIREDEWRGVQMAIARPMVRAAIAFVFTQTDPDIVAATAKNRKALYEASTAALQGETK